MGKEVTEALDRGSNLNVYEASFVIAKMTGHSLMVCDDVLKCFLMLLFGKLLKHNQVYLSRLFLMRLIKTRQDRYILRVKKKRAFKVMLREMKGEDLSTLEGIKRFALFFMKPQSIEKFNYLPLIEHLENRLRHTTVIFRRRIRQEALEQRRKEMRM